MCQSCGVRWLQILALCFSLAFFQTAHAEEQAIIAAPGTRPGPAEEACKPDESAFLPRGNLFRSLLADPKELRFYLGYRPYQDGGPYLSEDTQVFAGSLGDSFGFYRHVNNSGGYSWQAGISGGIFAEFDLNTSSFFLISTDYVIGFPVTFRKGLASYRVTFYHQSTHVGDEYLLNSTIKRIEFSYEALNAVGSYEWKEWRIYYGGEFVVHKQPSTYKPFSFQTGVEYYGAQKAIWGAQLIGGLDLKCTQQNGWPVNTSLKLGLRFDGAAGSGRSLRLMAEGYKGYSPHGQFYADKIEYVGIGLSLDFE